MDAKLAVGFVGRFLPTAVVPANGSRINVNLAVGFASQFPTAVAGHFRRIESRNDVNSAAWCAFHRSDHFRAVRHLMNRRAYSLCQFGSWVRSVASGMVVSAKTISRKAAKPQK
jgi:hypothetical protein